MIQVKISCNFVCSNLKDLFHFSNAYCLNIQAGHETQNYVLFILVGTSGIQLILALASFNHVCKLLKLLTVLSQLNPTWTFEDVNQKTQAFFHSWNKLRAGLCFRTSETENLKALLIPGILPEKTFVRGKTQKSRNFFYKESNHQILPSFGLFSRLLMQLCSTTHKTNYCPTKFGSQREVENNSH